METIPKLPQATTKAIATVVKQWTGPKGITSTPTYAQACEALGACQSLRKEITKHYTAVKRGALDHLSELRGMEKAQLEQVDPTERLLQELIIDYEDQYHAERQKAAESALMHPAGTSLSRLEDDLPKVKGQYNHPTLEPVVTDLEALVKAVASGQIPLEAVKPHLPCLRRMLTEQEEMFEVPGVEVHRRITVVIPS